MEQHRGSETLPRKTINQAVRSFSMRSMMGARMISMAKPILPAGTTIVLRRDMKESVSMLCR